MRVELAEILGSMLPKNMLKEDLHSLISSSHDGGWQISLMMMRMMMMMIIIIIIITTIIMIILPVTYIASENQWLEKQLLSFWDGLLSGATLILRYFKEFFFHLKIRPTTAVSWHSFFGALKFDQITIASVLLWKCCCFSPTYI